MNEESQEWLKENNGSKKSCSHYKYARTENRKRAEDYKLKVTYADYVGKGNCDASTQRM